MVKVISVVCGLIGAGKSTYSEEQGGIISDFDLIGDKDAQLMFTLSEHKKGGHVYHITCFPTAKEMETFEKLNVEYIWINTSFAKSMKNIFARHRERDMKDIEEVKSANANIFDKYVASRIDFKIIDVFEDNERW